MRAIEPVSVWFNGAEMQANRLNLYVINDNLKDSATFYYALVVETPIPTTTTTTGENPSPVPPGPTPPPPASLIQQVAQGNLSMTGQDYLNWNDVEGGTINEAAFVWAAAKLNLTLA